MLQDLFFNLVIVIGPLILAITVHEFCHIAAARWLGDDLGTRMGRFTLDPLKHIDPMWTVGLPVILVVMNTISGGMGIPFFAAGKPAPYNPNNLTRQFGGKRIRLRTAELLVAVAGPLSNLALAFLSLFGIWLCYRLGYYPESKISLIWLLRNFMFLNIALFVFNLIPIPPLDGSKVLAALLPHNAAIKFEEVGAQMGWVLLAFMIFMGGSVIGYAVHFVGNGMLRLFL